MVINVNIFARCAHGELFVYLGSIPQSIDKLVRGSVKNAERKCKNSVFHRALRVSHPSAGFFCCGVEQERAHPHFPKPNITTLFFVKSACFLFQRACNCEHKSGENRI